MEKEKVSSCYPHQRKRLYRLSDLIDIVEELHATVRALPEGASLNGVRKDFVLERLDLMLDQLWIDQKGFD